MASFNDNEIRELMGEEKPAPRPQAPAVSVPTTRKLLVIGCGDGGSNIASEIAKILNDDAFVIAYNTSARTMNNITADSRIIAKDNDGAGKFRAFSKDVFRSGIHKPLFDSVKNGVEKLGTDPDYVLVCATADGGTGSGISPMVCKLLMDNTSYPVIMLGVMPSRFEDATAQYNAIEWQHEIAVVGVPYFLMDNDIPGMAKPQIHATINKYASQIACLLAGKYYGNTNVHSIIDNRNLAMLTHHLGQRMVAAIDTTRPTTEQSLDDYVMGMISRCYQPAPSGAQGIGIFVKGPADYLSKIDVNLPRVREAYGNPILHFQHLEESSSGTMISILLTGCNEASSRIIDLRNRYDDIIQSRKSQNSVLDDALTGVSNPLGSSINKPKADKEKGDFDMSALEL